MSINFRRKLLGSSIESEYAINRQTFDRLQKQIDRLRKSCQILKPNTNNSPCMFEILLDFERIFQDIWKSYHEQLENLNEIVYFRIFLEYFHDLSMKMIDYLKQSKQFNSRKDYIKMSLYFSHYLMEMKVLFSHGYYQGDQFRLTKDEARDFWKRNFSTKILISWNEFREKFEEIHPIGDENEILTLKNTMDLTNNNHISIFEFDVFTRLFHPWSSLIPNWKFLTLKHPAFAAFLTYDEVKSLLSNHISKAGSYLFRLSCTRLGEWAIGYVTKEKSILQAIPRTKTLIETLIAGEREGYYKYPMGENISIDYSSINISREINRINVSEEQFAIYSDMDTSFELCKICSINNKNCQIQPCGHLLCQNCFTAWQNKNHSKSPALCPFCRSEIKGFQSIIINPFDTSPPPIPPRPVHIQTISSSRNFHQSYPPPLHSNNRSRSSLIISDDEHFQTIDDIRFRLLTEYKFDRQRIDAALHLTQGLALVKQYQMCKEFLLQVKKEYDEHSSNDFVY